VCPIRTDFLAIRDRCPFERVCPSGRQSPRCVPTFWYRLCTSALVHSCHMTSPFPPDTEPLSRCPSCRFCASLYHSSRWRSPPVAVFSITSSADKFGVSCFPSRWATTFGHGFLRLQFLMFVGQYKPKALELIPNRERGIWLVLINMYLEILCWGIQPEDWIYDWQRWDVKRRMWWNVDCIFFVIHSTPLPYVRRQSDLAIETHVLLLAVVLLTMTLTRLMHFGTGMRA